VKSVSFGATAVRYLRLEALSGAAGFASAAEIQVADVPPGR
jgi:hypothetical protein